MAGSGGSSTQSQNSQTSQNRDPWAPAQPHLQSIMDEGRRLYGNDVPTVADQDWRTSQGINNATSLAQGPNEGLAQLQGNQQSINGLRDRASGQTYAERYVPGLMDQIGETASGATAGNNPHLNAMLDVNASRIGNRVNSAMSGAGRYGSFAHGDQLATRINETNLPILSQSYENDRNRQLQAQGLGLQGAGLLDNSRRGADAQAMGANQMGMGLAPMIESMRYAPSQMMMNLGNTQQGQNQRNLDAPWQNLGRYGGSVSGLSGLLQGMGRSQGTSSSQTERENTLGLDGWAGLFSGGTNSGMSGMSSAAAPILRFLSDRNEKTDIKKIGKNEETGLDIYSYRYRGDPKSYPKVVGPMAQDIEKKYPGSTGLIDGKMYVKPEAAGLLG